MFIKKAFKAYVYIFATVITGGNFAYVIINPLRVAHPWTWNVYNNYSLVSDFCKTMFLIIAVDEILFQYKRCNEKQVDFYIHSERQDKIMSANLNMFIGINFSGNEKKSTSNHHSKTVLMSQHYHIDNTYIYLFYSVMYIL